MVPENPPRPDNEGPSSSGKKISLENGSPECLTGEDPPTAIDIGSAPTPINSGSSASDSPTLADVGALNQGRAGSASAPSSGSRPSYPLNFKLTPRMLVGGREQIVAGGGPRCH